MSFASKSCLHDREAKSSNKVPESHPFGSSVSPLCQLALPRTTPGIALSTPIPHRTLQLSSKPMAYFMKELCWETESFLEPSFYDCLLESSCSEVHQEPRSIGNVRLAIRMHASGSLPTQSPLIPSLPFLGRSVSLLCQIPHSRTAVPFMLSRWSMRRRIAVYCVLVF